MRRERLVSATRQARHQDFDSLRFGVRSLWRHCAHPVGVHLHWDLDLLGQWQHECRTSTRGQHHHGVNHSIDRHCPVHGLRLVALDSSSECAGPQRGEHRHYIVDHGSDQQPFKAFDSLCWSAAARLQYLNALDIAMATINRILVKAFSHLLRHSLTFSNFL